MEDNGNFFVSIFFTSKNGPLFCLFNHLCDAFRYRKIPDIPVIQNFFCGYRHAVCYSVKFRQRNRNGNFHGVHAFKTVFPFLIISQQRIRSHYGHIPLLQEINFQGSACRKGELGRINKYINNRNSITEKELLENFIQRGHPHFFIRHAIAEYTDYIHALLLSFFDKFRLVLQVTPYPFITVKQNTKRWLSWLTEILFIFSEFRVHLLGAGMKNTCPVNRVCFWNRRCVPAR